MFGFEISDMSGDMVTKLEKDAFLNCAIRMGRMQGWSYQETLEKLVLAMLEVKQEVFDNKVSHAAMSTCPKGFIFYSDEYSVCLPEV